MRQDCQLGSNRARRYYGESHGCVATRQWSTAGLAEVGGEALRVRQLVAASIVFTACPPNLRGDRHDKVAGVARSGRPSATRAVAMEEFCWFAVNFPGDRAANASTGHGCLFVHSHSSVCCFPSQFIAQGLLPINNLTHSDSRSGNIAGSKVETSGRCACREKGAGLND